MALLGTCSHILPGLLEHHGIEAVDNDGVVSLPAFPGYQIALELHGTENANTVELRAIFSMRPGQALVVPMFGMGENQEEAIMEAEYAFVGCVLHVWIAGLLGGKTEFATQHEWTIGGVPRKVTIGSVISRGTNDGANDARWQFAFHEAVRAFLLPEGLHWIDIYYAQHDNTMQALQVWLDNERCPQLEDIMAKFDWLKSPDFYTVRQFMTLQGGFDCTEHLDVFGEPLEEEGLIAAMQSRGVSASIAERFVRLGPLAFGRRLVESHKLQVSPRAIALNYTTSEALTFDLHDEWIFRDMERIGRSYPQMMDKEHFEPVAHRSAEVHALAQLLEAGREVAGSKISSIVVPMGIEALDHAKTFPSAQPLTKEDEQLLAQIFGAR
jgi:hypothetical protein